MDIEIPRIRIVRPQQIQSAVEWLVLAILKVSFPLSLLGIWKLYELIKPYLAG